MVLSGGLRLASAIIDAEYSSPGDCMESKMEPDNQWDVLQWKNEKENKQRLDRFPLIRPVHYELSSALSVEGMALRKGMGLTINVSNGGLCLLMNRPPAPNHVIRLEVPMPIPGAKTPTLAEVRWLRSLPLNWDEVYMVGLKFML
jgi:hypothetical protein